MYAQLIRNQDFVAGLLFTLVGLAAFWFGRSLSVGTATNMGPGYFPLILSGLISAMGLILAIKGAVGRYREIDTWHVRPVLFVVLALASFALMIERTGLAVAAIFTVVIGALAGPDPRAKEIAVLAIALTLISVGLFAVALKLPIRLWPS